MGKYELRLDWATALAAKHACEKYHYSRCIPRFKCVRIGVWEDGRFVGVVLFGSGATPEYGKRFGLKSTEVCELTRVALSRHNTPTSRIVAIALRFLVRHCNKLRLVLSFADSSQGHHGGIYQAGGWVYDGAVVTHAYRVNGVLEHPKTLHSRYGKGGQSIPWLRANVDKDAARVMAPEKHRYLMPLDAKMREQVQQLAKPYPKRVRSVDSDTSANHAEKGGANPTRTL